jgi:hypothetical protein
VREGVDLDPFEHRSVESAARKPSEGAFHLIAENWLAVSKVEVLEKEPFRLDPCVFSALARCVVEART